MRTKRYPSLLVALVAGLTAPDMALAQGDCLTTAQYPSAVIIPAGDGTPTTISTCNFLTEYSNVGGILPGGNYQFAVAASAYITVREGTFNGPVVAQGNSPVVVEDASGANLFPHWTVDASCATATSCVTTTVQMLLNCVPPGAAYTFSEDCEAGTFTVHLNITSVGDGGTVDVAWTVGGETEELTGQGVGQVDLGPFPLGTAPEVVLHHGTDPMCDLQLGTLSYQSDCPIPVVCGAPALQQSYCYVNSDNTSWTYQADGAGSLRLTFLAGSIESASFDHLTIYDGPDATGDQLFDHTQTSQFQLAGLEVFSATGSFFMVMTSDGSVSCSSGSQTPWEWEVVCLDCEIPTATVSLDEDCETG
ncbi:MAG: hypothetical protein RBT71_06990, partial [Flavobacteriales bacterium]|nr:hypothetical protein [Flavobacteriales bacterium]